MMKRVDHAPRVPQRARADALYPPAANDDATLAGAQAGGAGGGWDPYEIWASRVRDPRAGSGPKKR